MSDEQYSKAGRWMFLMAWIILFVVMYLSFSYFSKQESTVHFVSTSEFVLNADSEGHYRIKGKINGVGVLFLVDTGATSVAVPQKLAEQLNLKGRYPITVSTANGEVTGFLTRIPELSFGEFVLKDIKAIIIPNSDDDTVLLGMNVLSQFNIVQQGKQLILKRQ